MTTLLIDGDALVYQLAFSAETKTNWADEGQEPVWTIHADEQETTFRLMRAVEALAQLHWADNVVFGLSDPKANFRLDILPTYKGNRKDSRKPILHERMREVVQERFKTYLKPRLEADDTLGILATHPKLIPGDKIIITDDKDFKTIPAAQCRFKGNEVLKQNQRDAERYHMMQTLMGDMTDFYGGCPGIGKVKAAKLLEEMPKGPVDPELSWLEWFWDAVVVREYARKDLTEADALVQARCARILRYTDFDFKKGEPILWTPPRN